MHWIKPLNDCTLPEQAQVGSKAAHLGTLRRLGFPVPPGFVITAEAFTAHFGTDLNPWIRPAPPNLQTELMSQVAVALDAHLPDAGPLVVRSSFCHEAASREMPSGHHATYYFVERADLDQAILDCWMSLWRHGLPALGYTGWHENIATSPVMAVIVQQMVPAERSGMVYRQHHSGEAARENNPPEYLIEAIWGLGAGLADGHSAADHARVTHHGELRDYVVADKRYRVSPQASQQGQDRLQEIATEQRRQAVLDASECRHVANVAAQLEALFGAPQVVEWSFVGHRLHLLQSRPLADAPTPPPATEPLVLFKPLTADLATPLTPLTESLYAAVTPRIGAFFQGRFYISPRRLQWLLPFKLDQQTWIQSILRQHMPPAAKLSWRGVLRTSILSGCAALLDGASWIRARRTPPMAEARFLTAMQNFSMPAQASPLKLLRQHLWGRHPLQPIGQQMAYTQVATVRLLLYEHLLHRCVARLQPDFPLHELTRTYHTNQDLSGYELLGQMEHLATLLRDLLAGNGTDGQQVARVIAGQAHTLPANTAFTAAFETFLQRFGHRGPAELELAAPSWRQAPGSLLAVLAHYAAAPEAPQSYAAHLLARDDLHQSMRGWRRWLIDALVAKVSELVATRESGRDVLIMSLRGVRQTILEAEKKLLQQGRIKLAGDVFYLRHAELQELLAGTLEPVAAHQLVRSRRRVWMLSSQRPAAQTLNLAPQAATDKPLPVSGSNLKHDAVLQGVCASPGQAEAPARIIRSLAEAQKLQPGDILVAPYGDITWVPLFARAAAIVLASGSPLSQTGTLTRQLQTPCLVDVAACCEYIIDGQRIRVDATEGYVAVID